MRRLLSKIMVFVACSIVMMHAMIPHHNMSCGSSRLYLAAPYVHYGMCEESDDCYAITHMEQPIAENCNEHHHGHDSDGSPLNQCKLQELLTQLLISNSENDIYTAIATEVVLDLFFDEITQDALAAGMPIATCEWVDYVVTLPLQGVLTDAPLRAPPVC